MKQSIHILFIWALSSFSLMGQSAITPGAGQSNGDQMVVDWAIGNLIIGDVFPTMGRPQVGDALSDIPIASGNARVEKSETVATLIIFPNPAKDRVAIRFHDFQTANITLRILTATGQEVYHQQIANEGQSLWFDVSGYAAGSYLVQATDADQQVIIKKMFVP